MQTTQEMIEKKAELLKGFTPPQKIEKLISTVSNLQKLNIKLGGLKSEFIENPKNEMLIDNIQEELREYAKNIYEINLTYREQLRTNAARQLKEKILESEHYYIRLTNKIKRIVAFPTWYNNDWLNAGFRLHNLYGLAAVSCPISFTIKGYTTATGKKVFKLPKELITIVTGYIVFVFDSSSETINNIQLRDSNFLPFNTFHSHDGTICLGSLGDYLQTTAFQDGNIGKALEIVASIAKMLELINISSAYIPSENTGLIPICKFLEKRRMWNTENEDVEVNNDYIDQIHMDEEEVE